MKDDEPELESPYYPPRARFHAPIRNRFQDFRRRVSFVRKILPTDLSLFQLLLGFWVPGYSYVLFGALWTAWLIVAGWGLGAVAFLVLLNAPPITGGGFQFDPAYLAFGLMISLHATSASHLIVQIWHYEEFRERLVVGVAVTAFMIFLIYFPAAEYIHSHVFMAVTVGDIRVVVNPRVSPENVRRGDWVLYHVQEYRSGLVYVREGYGMQKVLGVPGDKVIFDGKFFMVNGSKELSLEEMPTEGEVTVPENHWFIWPEFNTMAHGNVAGQRHEAFLRLAMVNQREFAGRPYRWWLLGKQFLP